MEIIAVEATSAKSSISTLERLYTTYKQRINFTPHSKLIQKTCEYVIKRIRDGEFTPGEKISESKIAQDLGISSIPIREAMVNLYYEGWVDRIPNKGVFVKNINLEELKELSHLRQIIELGIIENLAAKISDLQLKELEDCLLLCEKSRDSDDFDIAEKAEAHFHRLLVHFSGNRKLELIFESILSQATNAWFRSCDDFPSLAQEVHRKLKRAHHRHIYEALKEHNPKKAKELLTEHLDMGYRAMIGIRELMDSLSQKHEVRSKSIQSFNMRKED